MTLSRDHSPSSAALGRWGEEKVARWYVDAGYTVLDRNWRVGAGELDLVVTKGRTVVFCEVKTRSSNRYGAAAEAVGWKKQRRIRGLAVEWLQRNGRSDTIRFDVASVEAGRVMVTRDAF